MSRASKYDRVYWTEEKPVDKGVPLTHWNLYNNYVLQYVKPGSIALDVGCGSGGGSALLSKKCSTVIGIDPSQKAMDYANKYNKKPNVEYLKVGIENLKEQKFDFICIIAVIEHLDNEKMAIEKCMGMLNPGGILIVYFCLDDYGFDEIKDFIKDYEYELMNINKDSPKAYLAIFRVK